MLGEGVSLHEMGLFGAPDNFGVNIRGEHRKPRITESITLPEEIFQKAARFGKAVIDFSTRYKDLVKDPDFRTRVGITEDLYKQRIEPFLNQKNLMVYFGADAVIDELGQFKFIEINPQPQVLGRYDLTTSEIVGKDNLNVGLSQAIKERIDKILEGDDGVGVVISHPGNAFHSYHELFSQQTGMPIATIQDLQISPEGDLRLRGKKVRLLFKQFSMNILYDPAITDPRILEMIKEGKVLMANGPLSPYLGDKPLFPELPGMMNEVKDLFPNMRVITTGEDVDVNQYKNWWLKGETRGSLEMTMQLSKDNRTGWVGDVVKATLRGDFDAALQILDQKSSQTAERMKLYVSDLRKNGSTKFVIQENIEPAMVHIPDNENVAHGLKTLVRAYFVPDEDPSIPPRVFMELFASEDARVSMAGFSIPIYRNREE